ncbi:MAG: hypothetical protein AAFV53_08720 [Myxococcota bacterium]
MKNRTPLLTVSSLILLFGCDDATAPEQSAPADAAPASVDVLASINPDRERVLRDNPAPWIVPACYANTQPEDGVVRNNCASCHMTALRPNFIGAEELQIAYAFPEKAFKNHWSNYFADRTEDVAKISDEAIAKWVRTDNYRSGETLLLADTIANLPKTWDLNGDGAWGGYTPDAWFDFDEQGFDRDPTGALTGWRAYRYRPFPGMFPAGEGSWGDALIRLPVDYRTTEDGASSLEVYKTNLAIMDAMILREDVDLEVPVDEAAYGVDLDGDGKMARATRVRYDWEPLKGKQMSWVGAAKAKQDRGLPRPTAGLLPEGAELLHSVRYVDVTDDGQVRMAQRMKELRYAVKARWQTYSDLSATASAEEREKMQFEDRLKTVSASLEAGAYNGLGWRLQGFIEDADGALRPQTYEETAFCVGCHGGIGVNVDSGFSFARRTGWGHSHDGMYGTGDWDRADGRGEIATYVSLVLGGDDYGHNTAAKERFVEDGQLTEGGKAILQADVSGIVLPTPDRAMALNKGYRIVVGEQSFTRGRTGLWGLSESQMHPEVKPGQLTGVIEPVSSPWARVAARE